MIKSLVILLSIFDIATLFYSFHLLQSPEPKCTSYRHNDNLHLYELAIFSLHLSLEMINYKTDQNKSEVSDAPNPHSLCKWMLSERFSSVDRSRSRSNLSKTFPTESLIINKADTLQYLSAVKLHENSGSCQLLERCEI